MKIQRKQTIEEYQARGRVVMLYGPRRVGKTTLVKNYLANLPKELRCKYDLGDDLELRKLFTRQYRTEILDYAKDYDVIVIDEAQNIPNIDWVAKIIIDEFPDKKIVLTGSSSFELSQQVGEPLVGRQFTMMLLPIAYSEIEGSTYEKKQHLEKFLIYGFYPEIFLEENNLFKKSKLTELISTYLFKDILALDKIKSPELLLDIVKALAYQIGQEVTINKLSKDTGANDPKKVGRYLDILQKTFVIKKINTFSTNPRNEINKPRKYYFYDLGIRNAVVGNFSDLSSRNPVEIGGLWENYIFMELYKKSNLNQYSFEEFMFWRNKKNNKEIDIIKTNSQTEIFAYECKWGKENPVFTDFLKDYPKANCAVVNPENFQNYLE